MADDQTNPYTMMGMAAMMQPNKYSLPQYKNGLSLPGFRGPATDAHGNVIQSYADALTQHDAWDAANPAAPAQGTTLNTTPAGLEPAGSPARATQNAGYGDWALLDPTLAASRQGAMGGEGSVAATSGWNPANPASATGTATGGATGTASGAGGTASGAAATNPVDMRQAYLDALANPGKVTTPGATIPASQPIGSPSVMDAFLAQNKGGGPAPAGGGYSNQGFFDTLNKLRSA